MSTPPPVTDPPPPPATDPDDVAKNALKGIIKETLTEWAEENKPAPSRTDRPAGGNLLNSILNFGKS